MEFEARPAPGTTYSQRRDFLYNRAPRFIELRNLATLLYKKDDGTDLLSYEETLKDRDLVREKILEYELRHNLIVQDSEAPVFSDAVPQEMSVMSFTPPPFNPAAAPPPPPATEPVKVEVVGLNPEPQPPPTTRAKRKAPGGGASVAPPPASTVVATAQPGFSPPAAQATPVGQSVPSFAPPMPVVPVQPQAPVQVDPSSEVLKRVDAIGQGLATLSAQLSDVSKELQEVKSQNKALLGVLFHVFLSNPSTAKYLHDTNGGKPVDFNWFKEFAKWAGQSNSP